MATDTNPTSDVLQSTTHSTLSAEQIAKAVARHKKDHSTTPEEREAAKPKKGGKK
jgi:hypothetical protein